MGKMTSVDKITSTGKFEPQYYPDYDRYQRRGKERSSEGQGPSPLSFGLPDKVSHGISWSGLEFSSDEYIVNLTHQQRQEIHYACCEFTASGRQVGEITRENFMLPSFSNVLKQKRAELHSTSGMLLLRGLDPNNYTRRENLAIFVGLAAHLSERTGIQSGGKMVCHIKDLASEEGSGLKGFAASYCNVELPVHTDGGDVIAMYSLSPTLEGGSGTFASVGSVYNELAGSHPDLLPILFQDDWPMDRPPDGKGIDGKGLYYRRPVMFMNHGSPEMVFSRGAIIRSPRGMRPPGIPNISEEQNDALDAMHFAAMKHLHRLQYHQGDILFFNNRKIVHGRDAFRDGDGKSRHMLRLWLKDETLAGPAPHRALEEQWRKIFPYEIAGPETERWPLEPDKS